MNQTLGSDQAPYQAVICFSIFSAAKPYHSAFIDALLKLRSRDNIALLILQDNYSFSEVELQSLSRVYDVFLSTDDPSHSVQETKINLIKQAACFRSDNIIFTDSDDCLHEDALELHFDVLEQHDFSYSDQVLINTDGELLGRCLFDNANVPSKLEHYSALLYQNYCGLSALGFKKATLEKIDLDTLAKDSIAPDWMLAMQALINGAVAAQTARPVVYYRQHAANYFKSSHQPIDYYEKKLENLIVHLNNLNLPETRQYLVDCQNALKLLTSSSNLVRLLDNNKSWTHFPWFQDIFRFVQSSKAQLIEKGYQ